MKSYKKQNKITDKEKKYENYKKKIKSDGYDFVFKKTNDNYNKYIIITEIWFLIKEIYDYTIEIIKNKKAKTITVISIGDSPVIFLLIFKKIFCNNNNINLKFLEISGLTTITEKEKEIGIEKLSNIEKFIETDCILWVDFVNSGDSFFNFLDLLPKNILKKSYFFIYGERDIKEHNRHKELKNIKFLFYNIYNFKSFFYFIASTIGHSEIYFMRCVNNKKIDKNYKLKLFDTNNIPLQKDIYGEHCINFSNFLYNEIESYYGTYFEE